MVRVRGRPRLLTVLGVAGLCVAVVAALAALALYLAPRVVPNLQARVSDADTVAELSADAARAAVTVPAGWVLSRPWGMPAEASVRSPDGRLRVTFTLAPEPPSAAFARAAEAHPLTPAVTDRLASGLEIVHADAATDGAVVASVGAASGPSVVAVARASTPAELAPYRAELARLVESVRLR